jgi:hypothetical protein
MLRDTIRSTRLSIAGLATAALVIAASVATQAAVTYFGLSFPDRVAASKRGPVTDYEKTNAGLGYSVEYLQPNWKINVYIYDLRKALIPDDLTSGVMTSQLKQAQGDIFETQKRGYYTQVNLRRNRTLRDTRGRARFLCSYFTYVHQTAGKVDSYLCLTGWRNKFVKIRMTAKQHGGSDAEADRFIRAWMKLLWPAQ